MTTRMNTAGVIRRAGFMLVLAAAAIAAFVPDWSVRLKAQGYYGAADLGVVVVASTPADRLPIAGEEIDYFVRVTNAGPDPAHRVRALGGVQRLQVLGTSGCLQDPSGFPLCHLATPLAVGESADFLLHARVPTLARGHLQLSISVTSDDDEAAPGDEVALLKSEISAITDFRLESACDRDHVVTGDLIQCSVQFRNVGLSAAWNPELNAYPVGGAPTVWTCESSRPGLCPPPGVLWMGYGWHPGVFEPGDWVVLYAQITATEPEWHEPALGIDASAFATEADAYYNDNVTSQRVAWSMFADGFDP